MCWPCMHTLHMHASINIQIRNMPDNHISCSKQHDSCALINSDNGCLVVRACVRISQQNYFLIVCRHRNKQLREVLSV